MTVHSAAMPRGLVARVHDIARGPMGLSLSPVSLPRATADHCKRVAYRGLVVAQQEVDTRALSLIPHQEIRDW
jgi:hypothetical protein